MKDWKENFDYFSRDWQHCQSVSRFIKTVYAKSVKYCRWDFWILINRKYAFVLEYKFIKKVINSKLFVETMFLGNQNFFWLNRIIWKGLFMYD